MFLTEEMASARGKFRKRLLKEVNEEGMNTDLRQSKSIGVLSESNTKKPEFVQRPWEPLSMDALLDLKGSFFERRNDILVQDPSRTLNVPA